MMFFLLLVGAPTMLCAESTNSPGCTSNSPAKPYPIHYCLVCGDTVGGTNTSVAIVFQGQEMKFCCERCVKTFRENPAKYLKKLHDFKKPEVVLMKSQGNSLSSNSITMESNQNPKSN